MNRNNNSENFEEWKANVEKWKVKYGISVESAKPATRGFLLTSIVVVKRCAKCNSVRVKMHRHHKGHEYLFACLMEGRYAARYIQFHPDDVAWLCVRCHKRAHTIYKRILKGLWDYVNARQYLEQELEYEVLEEFRQRIIAAYERWVKFKKRKKKKKYGKSKRKSNTTSSRGVPYGTEARGTH